MFSGIIKKNRGCFDPRERKVFTMALDWAEMQKIQLQLREKYREQWGDLSPEEGRSQLLWMMIEAGEVADVIKKQGDNAIMNDPAARAHFVEELCDVIMFFNEVMLCYSVSPQELETAYREKHEKNMNRW